MKNEKKKKRNINNIELTHLEDSQRHGNGANESMPSHKVRAVEEILVVVNRSKT
jgi:hypothetical protein